MNRKKKIILGTVAASAIIYFATRKKSGTSPTLASKNSNNFQLSNLTNDLWTNDVDVSSYDSKRGWRSQTQLLVNKPSNEHFYPKLKMEPN